MEKIHNQNISNDEIFLIKPTIYTSSNIIRAYPLVEGTTFKVDGNGYFGVYDNLIYRLIPVIDQYNINAMSYIKSDISFTFEEYNAYIMGGKQ